MGKTEPEWKKFIFECMAQEPEAELVSILSQVMKSWQDLDPQKREAVSEWFAITYGKQT